MLLAIVLALLVIAPAEARPGELDRTFKHRAFALDGGGAVYGLHVAGSRPLLSIGSPYGGGPATLTLTVGGRLARRTALGALSPPWFADGHALTRTGPQSYTLTRIGDAPGVVLEGAGELWGFGVDGAGRALLTFGTSLGRGRWRTEVARYLPGGALDPRYGRVSLGDVEARPAFVRRDGRVFLIAGRNTPRWRVLVLGADGRRVPFAGRSARLAGPAGLLAAPGGRLLVMGGDASQRGWLIRLRPDGHRDRGFGDRGLVRLRAFTPYGAAVDRRGRIVLAGAAGESLEVHYDAAVLRLDSRGRRDRSFRMSPVRFPRLRGDRLVGSEARFLALDARGRIVIAGEAYDANYRSRDDAGYSYPAIARLQS